MEGNRPELAEKEQAEIEFDKKVLTIKKENIYSSIDFLISKNKNRNANNDILRKKTKSIYPVGFYKNKAKNIKAACFGHFLVF